MFLVSAIKPNESKRRGRRQRPSELTMNVKSSDQMLVQRAQSGEHSAFNALVRKYRHRVMKLSLRYTRNYADAEDAVQNTFIKAYWAIQSFRGEAAFYSWLHRIAINSAKTVLSLRAREARVFKSDSRDDDAMRESSMLPKELDTPEELALTHEICGAVNRAIDALGEEQRIAIVLRELQGLSYSEVAAAMSCPIGTVRSRVFRARDAIDSQLRDVLDEGLGRAKHAMSSRSWPTQEVGTHA